MSVGLTGGFAVKEFKGTCPMTGMTFMRAYSRATSRNAKRFLHYLVEQTPFDIQSIQVDGGSEFRDEFETACKELNIALFVLPPKSPKLNGCVERANGTTRYDFYPFYGGALTVEAVNRGLDDFQSHYNAMIINGAPMIHCLCYNTGQPHLSIIKTSRRKPVCLIGIEPGHVFDNAVGSSYNRWRTILRSIHRYRGTGVGYLPKKQEERTT